MKSKRVGPGGVAEPLGHGQGREGHAEPGAGGLVHLAEAHHGAVDDRLARAADLGLLHFQPEVVALAGSLADAGEHRVAAVHRGDAGDQLGEDDRLAQPGAAEEADLAAADERRQQVDDLDAGLELLGLGREAVERGRVAVDRPALAGRDRASAVDRVAQEVEDPAERLLADRHADRPARVDDRHAPDQPVGRTERHAADPVAAEVLLDLAGQVDLDALFVGLDGERVVDFGQVAFVELGVEGRADHLGDPSGLGCGGHVVGIPRGRVPGSHHAGA